MSDNSGNVTKNSSLLLSLPSTDNKINQSAASPSKNVEMSRGTKLLSPESADYSENNGTLSPGGSRSAMLSPSNTHRDYNRYKYYSALRTGFKHLGQEDQAFLEPPSHIIDHNLFLIHNPFNKPRKFPSHSLLTNYDNSTNWREAKLDHHHFQCMEDNDWVSGDNTPMGLSAVRPGTWPHNLFRQLRHFILHLHVDH